MNVEKIIRGRALYTEKDRVWIAQGMSYFAIDYAGRRLTDRYAVGSRKKQLLAKNRLSRQLFRQGIHHLIPLLDGNVFLTTKKTAYVIDKTGNNKYVFQGYQGNKPAHQGVCVAPNGYIYFGEYTLNPQRDHDSHLYRSIDGGKSFQIVYTMKKNEVRHIHFVKWDPYEECLWLGTGDRDSENLLLRSDDYGESWEKIGGGTQDWRAIGICFTRDNLIWGTDAGSVPDQNHIIKMNRKTNRTEVIADVEGPCHGCGTLKDGRVFISTGVEGGQNEKDCFARLKQIDGKKVWNLVKYKKDIYPLIMQYGVIRFPLGIENSERVVFTTYGLKSSGEHVYVEKK